MGRFRAKSNWYFVGAAALVAVVAGWSLGGEKLPSEIATTNPPLNSDTTGSIDQPKPAPGPGRVAAVLEGKADVIDTVTLLVGERLIRLYGTEWARGGKVADLKTYLAGRYVRCAAVQTADVYRCQVGEQDLSRVVLFNGGARAAANAPPELKDAQEQAKAAHRGVWSVPTP